ncbi:hypothetical protein SteCoe_30049 [Stentor coeruleus]|uniref:RAP domain-containing protein n=1 Tax=Stentor coeruleus TaxID=5963 RepID=A0A1R2B4X6_9CILI|nr:hypothetical protein SteCoe_30049 [Stentor coeruleus]
MAINLYNFEINDFIKIAYWLTSSNYLLQKAVINKLDSAISILSYQITTKNWFRLLNLTSNIGDLAEFDSLHSIKQKMDNLVANDTNEALQALLDMAKLEYYNRTPWINLLKQSFKPDYSNLETLRIIKLAVETEVKSSLKSEAIEHIENLQSSVFSQTKNSDNLTKSKHNMSMLSASRLHREVDFILKLLLQYEENSILLNTYSVDFYNESEKLVFDIHGPLHYFFPDMGDKHESITQQRLVGMFKMKNRLLIKNGFKVANIPYFEWNRYIDQLEKTIYLKRKLRYLRL